MRRVALFTAVSVLAFGCSSEPTVAPASSAVGHFTIHEWGLIGVSVAAPFQASIATQVPTAREHGAGSFGHIGSGGKPVLYVHLDEGTERVRFDLELSVPASSLVERWPTGGALDTFTQQTRGGWRGVVATRGPCADESPPPAPLSRLCATRDDFCEAVEIPRYSGDRASCLTVGAETSELLFYRAESVSTSVLPLRLEHDAAGWKVRRTGNAPIEGPIFFIESPALGADVMIRRLGAADFGAALAPPTGVSLTPSDVRAALLAEATRRGLSTIEADAFVDAWSPAFFDSCRRQGPTASGVAPATLAQAGRSLIYFAPEIAVDSMLPLTTTPRARAVERVFLVRFIDPSSTFEQPAPGSEGEIGHGSGGSAPCTEHCPRVTFRDPTASTGLDASVVRRVVQRSIGQLRYCYEQALRNSPELHGAVTLGFSIRRDGSVGTSSIASSTLHSAPVERCFEVAVRRFVFPMPEPASDVTVRLPLELSIVESPPR